VIGRFESSEPVLNGRPAVTRRKVGKGAVLKLAFWPQDDSVLRLFAELAPDPARRLAAPTPPGIQAVPRTDGSLFVINTTPGSATIRLARTASDRISGRSLGPAVQMRGYEVLWLE